MDGPSKTLDNRTYASDPGHITLSDDKLRELRPDLHDRGCCFILSRAFDHYSEQFYIREHLHYGDSRAAVVVSTSPLLVAAYTDELDCVAILRFPDHFCLNYSLRSGSRLLTVNTYKTPECSPSDKDLIPGPHMIPRWVGFNPIIADFLTDDQSRLATRKMEISEAEWQRAQEMGNEYVELRPGVWREGRPAAGRHNPKSRYSCCPADIDHASSIITRKAAPSSLEKQLCPGKMMG